MENACVLAAGVIPISHHLLLRFRRSRFRFGTILWGWLPAGYIQTRPFVTLFVMPAKRIIAILFWNGRFFFIHSSSPPGGLLYVRS